MPDAPSSISSSNPSADLLIRSLAPDAGEISSVETHVSTVVFQDGWAYKVKKPVCFEFIDLSTPELRGEMCRRELTLNRRFAPDVYDRVVEIRNAAGAVVDHAVRMRRMPAERRLSSLVMNRDPRVEDAVRAVAKEIAGAHANAPRGAPISAVAEPGAIDRLWRRSLDDMARMVGTVFDEATFDSVRRRAHDYIFGRHDLFRHRIGRCLVVDGHGDLLADDIFCLDDGPRMLDCLEFDDHLRYGDVLADVAFLAMDLERLGQSDLSERFLRWYTEFSDEHHPMSLQHHYIAYRALVRAKIAAMRANAAQGDVMDRVAVAEANNLLGIAARHLKLGAVTLVVVGGLPGSGKSTLAESLAGALGWPVIRSDLVRKELVGAGNQSRRSPFGTGIYNPNATTNTYHRLFDRAETALRLGESSIIDASFSDVSFRQQAADVASATTSGFLALRCEAPMGELRRRLQERTFDPLGGSDATPDIALEMEARADPWPASVAIDTSASPDASCDAALRALEAR